MNNTAYKDEQARQRALSSHDSFIIQAPAGSGKTELLIQRFLVLLATVDYSDQVLAITFTKKAAGEMRCRINQALERAKNPKEPEKPHEKLTWNLARKVFQHAENKHWDMTQITSELSIMTIDACCQKLLGLCQPPYQFQAQLALCLYPKPFYRKAVHQFIQTHCIHNNARFHQQFQSLLLYQHHDINRVEQLLISALMNREKWLRITLQTNQHDFQDSFMQAIAYAQNNHIQKMLQNCPIASINNLITAASRIQKTNHTIHLQSPLDALCNTDCNGWDIQQWQKFATLTLNQKGECRKKLTATQGFAAKSLLKSLSSDEQIDYQSNKDACLQVLAKISEEQQFIIDLHDCHRIPEVKNPEEEWQCLQPMLQLLPSLAAYLQLQINEEKMTDFAGINIQLLSALLDETQQHHLVFQVYQQYQHCLIDEFQDTSVSQFEILERALSAWKEEPHRSITVVGDPMQSIYRFRQAEVKLFRHVQENGFAGMHLENLYLSKNYRSSDTLVNQLNQCFTSFMTPQFNVFSASEAVFHHKDSGLIWHQADDKSSQNKHLCTLIKKLMHQQPNASKCLLVRSRSQLNELLPLFQQHGIQYSGVGIHALSQCQAVLDCFHLCCLTLNLYNRLHWVAFLRSPAIAMPLQDIEKLCQDKHACIWDEICNKSQSLSSEGQSIIARIQPLLRTHLATMGRVSYVKMVKKLWLDLGSPWVIEHPEDQEKCQQFFDLTRNLEDSGQSIDEASLRQILDTYPESATQAQADDLQIMTIHKSKGLEFDIVIMPHLEQSTPISEKTLLDWIQVPHQSSWHLLMHVHPRHRKQASSVHHYLRHQDKLSQLAETERLYYVAFTRAKRQLHILNTQSTTYPERSPMKNLAPVLSLIQPSKTQKIGEVKTSVTHNDRKITRKILPPEWEHPQQNEENTNIETAMKKMTDPQKPTPIDLIKTSLCKPEINEATWGNLVHRYIEYRLHQVTFNPRNDPQKFCQIADSLGIDAAVAQTERDIIYQQLMTYLKRERFQWIHALMQEQLIEQPIIHQGKQMRVDSICINHSKQKIWIIDYKTHSIANLLNNKTLSPPSIVPKTYWQQVQHYAESIQTLYPDYAIHIALYYPLIDYWQEEQYRHITTEISA